jgi:hypothetical protein
MRYPLGLLDLTLPTLINASVIGNVKCLVVDIVVQASRAYPTATPFCSSFLGISTQSFTVSTTSTETTVTTTVVTGTTTVFSPTVTATVAE